VRLPYNNITQLIIEMHITVKTCTFLTTGSTFYKTNFVYL